MEEGRKKKKGGKDRDIPDMEAGKIGRRCKRDDTATSRLKASWNVQDTEFFEIDFDECSISKRREEVEANQKGQN